MQLRVGCASNPQTTIHSKAISMEPPQQPLSICFYDKKEPFYEFSNFFTNKNSKPIVFINDLYWRSTEQYFQAAKFFLPESARHMEYYNIIQSTDSPMKCVILGQQKIKGGYAGKWVVNKLTDDRTLNDVIHQYSDLAILPDWHTDRDDIMYTALTFKFTQNKDLEKMLIKTGTTEIIEASPRDNYWGWGADKQGKNMLGKILMRVRSDLQTVRPLRPNGLASLQTRT